jgi:hypothetical protein
MRLSFLLFSVLFVYTAEAQTIPVVKDTSISLDLLRGPVSPAANLAGISPSDIEKPTDAAGFMVSLQQATTNFSQLPKSYAVDFAPGLLFKPGNLTIDRYLSNTFHDNFNQSFTLSAAVRVLEADEEDSLSLAKTKLAMGFKFSVLRGNVDKTGSDLLNDIVALQSIIINDAGDKIDSVAEEDSIYMNARARMREFADETGTRPNFTHWQSVAIQRKEAIAMTVLSGYEEQLTLLKTKAVSFRIRRVGWKVDVSGGLVLDFLDQRFTRSLVSRTGLWVTGGYEGETGWSFLGIARYLYNPDKIFADEQGLINSGDIHTGDLGARLIFSAPKSRFSLSSEAIYRSVLNDSPVGSTWRLTINADYDFGQNKKLTFAFGRDFDGTVSKAGNLITAIQFLAGFGSKKTIANK